MAGIFFLIVTAIAVVAWLLGSISGWAAVGIIVFVLWIIGAAQGNSGGGNGPGGGGGGKKLPLPVKMAGAGAIGYAIGKKMAKM